ncbi:MAG: hypothetical protein Q9M36_01925 [Sulfurovum sp.]|nr:hypothetical protein [Sulfurovum sp.]
MSNENQKLREELDIIEDEEARKSIEQRIAENEQNLIEIVKQQSTERSFELQLKNILEEIETPYKYLKTHIKMQYALVSVFAFIIMGFLWGFVAYGKTLYHSRESTFLSLFPTASNTITTVPDFGTIFGVMFYYGTPIFVAIAIMAYLFSQINHTLDKIRSYQSKEQKINEFISIVKVKNILGFKDPVAFRKEINLLLNEIKEVVFEDRA